jgi:hypothetical protein
MELRIEQTGEETVIRRLRGMEERAANLAPIFEKLAADFYRFEGDVFRTEGAVNASGQWKPLSPRYAAWKAKRYPGRRILRLTGKLRSSLVKSGGGREHRGDHADKPDARNLHSLRSLSSARDTPDARSKGD